MTLQNPTNETRARRSGTPANALTRHTSEACNVADSSITQSPTTEQSRVAYLNWCDDCEAIKHGIAFPGPDGFSHYRYAYEKITDSMRLDCGVRLALTWLQNAMPTYQMLLGDDKAAEFEATIKAVCAGTQS